MSDTIKNKLYNFEETPPSSVWEKVSLSLDEKLLQKSTVAQLYNQEETPPINTWNKIANALDTNIQEAKFRNDILEVEVAPPPFTWNKIAQQLDVAPEESISQRVQDFEIAPPGRVWGKIAATLDADEEDVPVMPTRKSYSKIIRIAAAAAIIGIITWIGFSIVESGKTNYDNSIASNEPVTTKPIAPVITSNPAVTDEENNNPKNGTDNQPAHIKAVTQKPGVTTNPTNNQGTNDITITETDNHTASEDFAVSGNKNLHKKQKSSASSTGENKTEARYFVYFNEQGDMVNLSKKLADLKCIYNNDGGVSQESLAKLGASECNEQVKYWQDKMANASLQSSSNPLELIEVLK